MTRISSERLWRSRLVGRRFDRPEDAVRHLGAVQSQDYAGAKWALGLRCLDVSDAGLDRLFDEGRILRTHVLRPTWHFVSPGDIRWMLDLTAARVRAASGYQLRQLEIDQAVTRKSHRALAAAMEGGRRLTRKEIGEVFERAGIEAAGLRGTYLVMLAELAGLICSGGRRGRQFTYALLEEVAPPAPPLDREAALAELATRYFESHGPARAQDFAWWSGLTMDAVKTGIELLKPGLSAERVDGREYWAFGGEAPAELDSPLVHLLPNFDEYLVAYKGYGELVDFSRSHLVVLDGKVVGGWQRTLERDSVVVTTDLWAGLGDAEQGAVESAAAEYGRFLGTPVTLRQRARAEAGQSA